MALDIQIGLLLPGKAGAWQIFGCGAAADGNIYGVCMAVGTEAIIRLENGHFESRRQGGSQHGLAHLPAPLAEIGEVMGIQVLEQDGDLLIQVRFVQEHPVGIGGDGKARWDTHPHGG